MDNTNYWLEKFVNIEKMMEGKNPPLKIRDVAEAIGTTSTGTAMNALCHWEKLGLVVYVSTGKEKGEWYLNV